MKVASVFALFLTTATAFQQVKPAFRSASTTALSITKEEDLELTRKVIQDFEAGMTGTAIKEEEPEPEKKEKAAAAEE